MKKQKKLVFSCLKIPTFAFSMLYLAAGSIFDKLVEKCIQLVIEPWCETQFVNSSFGYREQVSEHNALAKVKNQCQTMPYVLSPTSSTLCESAQTIKNCKKNDRIE